MKRSEMIKVIKDVLYCHLPQYSECPDFIAECLLQSIEGGNKSGEGMVPPIIEEESWKILPNGEMTYAVHEWVPE